MIRCDDRVVNVTECLINYGKAWFEPDHARRVEVLRTCCTDDIIFVDSNGRAEGLDAPRMAA